jgi:DNA-binding winged helix-turn-helix (wHTH) protein
MPQQNLSKSSTGQILRFIDFEVDFLQRELRKQGLRVPLQQKPFQILELLLRRPGTLVTREEMAKFLWPDSHVGFDQCLNTAVNVLRQTLGDNSSARLIETRSGLGYVFAAPVTQEEVISQPATGASDYLKGRYLLNKMTEEDTAKAVAFFEAALLDDERSALACAGLADTWCEFARLWMTSPASASLKAKEYAVRALSNDSQIPESHIALARAKMLLDSDSKAARQELERALEIDKDCAAAHRAYANLLSRLGDLDSAFRHLDTAYRIEPLSIATGIDYAWLLFANRRLEDSAAQCWKMLSLDPRLWPAQLLLSVNYHELKLREESIAEVENAVTCSGRHPVPLALLGHFDSERADFVQRELAEQSAARYVPLFAHTLPNQLHPNFLALLR